MEDRYFETDHGRSWMVAICCCFCNMIFYGVSRLSGIMLVAATHTFNVSRASAAVPFSLSTAIRSLAGMFVGHLGHRFGVGRVVAVGCLIASLGSGLCFFAVNVTWLTVCWGAVFGIGFGLSTCLLPLAINQNFTKRSGIASGISYSGAYIGSFIFPPIVVTLLDQFGLQGTFLIISGAVLNVFVAAILLSRPKRCLKTAGSSYYDTQSKVLTVSQQYNEKRAVENRKYSRRNSIVSSSMHPQVFVTYELKSGVTPVCLSCGSSSRRKRIRCSLLAENTLKAGSIAASIYCPGGFKYCTVSNQYENSKQIRSSFPITAASTDTIPEKYTYIAENKSVQNAGQKREGRTSCKSVRRDVSRVQKKRSKLKTKSCCRLNLKKIKRVFETSLLKSSTIKNEISQARNVQLLSYKILQPIWCPVILVPSETFILSPHSLSKSVRNNNIFYFRVRSKAKKYSINFPIHSENRDKNYNSNEPNVLADSRTNLGCTRTLSQDTETFPSFQYRRHNSSVKCAETIHEGIEIKCSTLLETGHLEHICIDCKENSRLEYIDKRGSYIDRNCNNHFISNSGEQFMQRNSIFQRVNSNLSTSSKPKKRRKCLPDWIHMFCEPMFMIISCTMSIQTFVVVCVVTTIEDYAKDVGISESKGHYALMALSIANLLGTLTMGVFTDRGLISRHRFIALCFFGMSLALIAVSLLAVSLPSLLSVVAIYGLLESGVVITFPILTKQFVKGERRQAVAIASSNALSAPTVMLVPMLIGHFRDNIGCYSGLFHLLGATSLICSLVWLVAPSFWKRKNRRSAYC